MFFNKYITPPKIAIKIFITKTIREKVRALAALTPKLFRSKTNVFSLTPNPPRVIGRFEADHIIGTIKIYDKKLNFILRDIINHQRFYKQHA